LCRLGTRCGQSGDVLVAKFRTKPYRSALGTASTPAAVQGYMLTRAADPFGRCISFLGRCVPPEASGSSVFVDIPMLADTANHHMVCTGLVYSTYYPRCSRSCEKN
jgi:hypothetical protein